MRTTLRTKIAKRVCVRISVSSHSLRAILQSLCDDPETPIGSLRRLDAAVTPKTDDLDNWNHIIDAVGKPALLRALLALCRECTTGPVTATVITESYAQAVAQRRTAAAAASAAADDSAWAWEAQMHRQACLARLVDRELTSRHERCLE